MTSSYEALLKKMKEQADTFASHLTELNNLNNDVREKIEKLMKGLTSMLGTTPPKTCNVCYHSERLPTHVFVPCGHGGVCQACAERGLSRNRCFQCRARIESIVRIFFN